MSDITPTRIEWRTPFGWAVVLDEDFVSIRVPSGCIEESEINVLLEYIHEAKRCRSAGHVPIPKPPLPLPF